MDPAQDFGRQTAVIEILSALEQGVAVFNKDRRLIFSNPAMKRITGAADSAGWPVDELEQRNQLRDETGRLVEKGDFPVERAFKGEELHNEIFEYLSPDNSHIWLEISATTVHEKRGDEYVVVTVNDVSEKRSHELKLKFLVESEKILSVTEDFRERVRQKATLAVPSLADWCAVDILNEGGSIERIVVVHRDPAMVRYVKEFEKRYPSDPEAPGSVTNVIRTGIPVFVPVVTDEMLRAAAKSEQHYKDIARLQLHSVMTIPIESRGKALGAMTLAYAESGRTYSATDLEFFHDFCRHLGVLLDNARLYDEIIAHVKAKDHFLASLAHELRNPLAPIRSSLEMLSLKAVPEDIREEISVVEHQFDHMAKLLADLLDVNRFTSGKISIEPGRAELTRLVQRALKASESLIRSADISLSTHFPASPVYVHVDDTRLEQAVQNILANAVKFTPAGGAISVDIRTDETCAYIRISDTGAGIPEKDMPHIFDMYFQGAGTSGTNAGLGIGLPLVKRIAEMHGGTVEAESMGSGTGSAFTFRLPLSRDVPDAPEAQAHLGKTELSVLIVDDNAPAADALVKLLRKIGIDARAHYSARETLEDTRLGDTDVLLLDIGMPEMDGYELVKKLRALGLSQPIIALTGYGLESDILKTKNAGFTTHLTKPVGLRELRGVFADVTHS